MSKIFLQQPLVFPQDYVSLILNNIRWCDVRKKGVKLKSSFNTTQMNVSGQFIKQSGSNKLLMLLEVYFERTNHTAFNPKPSSPSSACSDVIREAESGSRAVSAEEMHDINKEMFFVVAIQKCSCI